MATFWGLLILLACIDADLDSCKRYEKTYEYVTEYRPVVVKRAVYKRYYGNYR